MKKAKKRMEKAVCFLCMVTLMLTMLQYNVQVINVKADDEYTYEQLKEIFPDENMLNSVYKELELDVGSTVNIYRLRNLSRLSISGDYTTDETNETLDLTGINYIKNLQNLYIRYYRIENLSSVKINELQELKVVNMYSVSGVKNFEGFEELTKIYSVSCKFCDDLESLSGLENCTGMKDLYCEYNKNLTDISVCSNFSNLRMAVFMADDKLADVSALAGCHSLTCVDLYHTQASDISELKNKTGITNLNLGCTNVFQKEADRRTTCEVLQTLPNVNKLGLRDAKVNDDVMDIVCTMTNVNSLDLLDNSYITDISKLVNLPNLTELDIGGNAISDFSYLSSLTHLSKWSVSNVGAKYQNVVINGSTCTFDNPVIGMDGKAAAPNESEVYTYDSRNNTITINESYKGNPKYKIVYDIPMSYQGNAFNMRVNVSFNVDVKAITIKEQPVSVESMEETKTQFKVKAESQDDNFTYQWYKDGSAIAGETDSSIVIDSIKLTDAGSYLCVVNNNTARAVSNAAVLTVKAINPITITKQPESVQCIEGGKAEFEVTAQSADSNFTYQWYKDGSEIVGETNAKIVINGTELKDAGKYLCIVKNETSSTTSNMATLTVNKKINPITITKQPNPIECTEGEKAELEVKAESEDDDFAYQWYKDGEEITGETSAKIVFDVTKSEDTGRYSCVVKNATSSTISNVVMLTVNKKQEPTTKESTTKEQTTKEPTTKEQTTEEPTTEEQTTKELTTEKPTAEESTTEELTTEEPATKERTAEELTTKQQATEKEESTTEQKIVKEQVTKETTAKVSNQHETTTGSKNSTPKTGDSISIVVLAALIVSAATITLLGKKNIRQ